MKLTCLFILVALHLSASTFSQTTKIDLELNGVGIVDLFHRIEKKTAYKFVFSAAEIPAKSIDLKVNGEAVSQVLDEAFEGTGLSWQVLENNLIAIVRKKKPLKTA